MQRNISRRAFRPPSSVDKPQSEKSKVADSEDPTISSKQKRAHDLSASLQPVKRRKLLVCPASLTCPPSSSTQKANPAIFAPIPHPGRHEAFPTAIISPARTKQAYTRSGISTQPGDSSPARSMPEPLPDMYIEQTSLQPGASFFIAGQLAISGPRTLPSGGAPLLDTDTIQRMQAALIPKQVPQTASTDVKGFHAGLDAPMCDIDRSSCKLPGQWLAHGGMARITMPELETPHMPASACPAMSHTEQASRSTAMIEGADTATRQVYPPSKAVSQQGCEQLAGPPSQQAGGKKLWQKRLNMQHAGPVSLDNPEAAQCPAAADCDGLHAAILTQLELQDEEMEEVLRSPEKQLGEVMRHPSSMLGVTLDLAFLKSVCNV